MMILLTKEEYNELCQKATSIDAQAEARLEEPKTKLKNDILKLMEQHDGRRAWYNRSLNMPFFEALRDLLATHY